MSEHAPDRRRRWGGFRFNQPVDPKSPTYERPPVWRRQVAPTRVLFPPYIITFCVALAVSAAAGVPDRLVFGVSICLGFLAQGGAELWWRSKHRPSTDRPYRRLVSRK